MKIERMGIRAVVARFMRAAEGISEGHFGDVDQLVDRLGCRTQIDIDCVLAMGLGCRNARAAFVEPAVHLEMLLIRFLARFLESLLHRPAGRLGLGPAFRIDALGVEGGCDF
ncbi:hypothetical protein [Dongia sp.]|uniref:hypothetical protein n=1 Tax=Dongia sp. TaxID=1977262 RepID=UPI0034A3871C